MAKWINIKDKLPEHESIVDVYTKDRERVTDVLFANYPTAFL
jgi:hypothetical protein